MASAAAKRIALTIGDPAGVGPELVVAALLATARASEHELVVIGDERWIGRCARQIFGASLPSPAHGRLRFEHLEIPIEEIAWGCPSAASGAAAEAFVARACALAKAGAVDAICTAPIDKVALRAAQSRFVDHTAMLAAAFGVDDPLTIFLCGQLRIFFASRHLSLRDAIEALSARGLEASLVRAFDALRVLGLKRPHIALAALNPHASDGGRFGDEERDLLQPALDALRGAGERVSGPIGADSVFYQAASGCYDAVMALYHDQGHIAAKTRDFFGTIAATLGLPVPRTSVDHGTAMDLAGTGRANPRSLMLALEAAATLAQGRLP